MANKTRVGLFFGVAYGLCHLSWILLLAFGWAQPMMDWLMPMHFINITYTLSEVAAGKAVLGIVMAFVWGFVDGFIIAALWNWIVGEKR